MYSVDSFFSAYQHASTVPAVTSVICQHPFRFKRRAKVAQKEHRSRTLDRPLAKNAQKANLTMLWAVARAKIAQSIRTARVQALTSSIARATRGSPEQPGQIAQLA